MEFLFRNAYTLVVLIPALLIGPGCGGDPPKPPPGAPTESGDELEVKIEVEDDEEGKGPSLEPPSGDEDDPQDAGAGSDESPE